jgi:hypothetical protein
MSKVEDEVCDLILGKMTIRYKDGKKIEEITGDLVPCDGPFGRFLVVHDGKEHIAIADDAIISMRGDIPPQFIIPIEIIQKAIERKKRRAQNEMNDNEEVYFS